MINVNSKEECAQVPLLNGPVTLTAYRDWAGSDPPAAVKAGYDKAQAVAATRKDLEVAVAAGKPADMDLLASYMAYVKLEQVKSYVSENSYAAPDHQCCSLSGVCIALVTSSREVCCLQAT